MNRQARPVLGAVVVLALGSLATVAPVSGARITIGVFNHEPSSLTFHRRFRGGARLRQPSVTPLNGQATGQAAQPQPEPAQARSREAGKRDGSCRGRRTASRTCRATGPTKRRRRSSAWAPGRQTLTDEQAQQDRRARAGSSRNIATRPAIRIARAPPKGGEAGKLAPPGERSFIEQIAEAAGGAVGGYNGFWLDPGLNVIRIDGVARSSIIIDPAERPRAGR